MSAGQARAYSERSRMYLSNAAAMLREHIRDAVTTLLALVPADEVMGDEGSRDET